MSSFICKYCGMTNIDCGKQGYKTDKEIVLEKQLKIAVEALESLRTKKTVIDKVTGDAYYIWDYALNQIKELDK